jgi:hypothetical protein
LYETLSVSFGINPWTAKKREYRSSNHDSHAGDAVVTEPVSRQIPCKQGIFQGILEISTEKVPLVCKKPLRHSDCQQNSL